MTDRRTDAQPYIHRAQLIITPFEGEAIEYNYIFLWPTSQDFTQPEIRADFLDMVAGGIKATVGEIEESINPTESETA